jgi:glycogen operon protein
VGPGGYQLGNFPPGWSEWNDRYRDTVRRYWRGDEGMLGEFARRLTGSSDIFEHGGRRPWSTINFVTAHDGFTLEDLVSYDHKHNEANLEGNADGANHHFSWNCGVEGPADDPAVRALRARQKRNMMTTLLLSMGVPMLLAGDEFGRTQSGNNNAYCQDNEISWACWEDWSQDAVEFLDFVRRLIRLRRDNPAFQRRSFFDGRSVSGAPLKDVTWFNPDRSEMTEEDWHRPSARSVGVQIPVTEPGDAVGAERRGVEGRLLLLFSADPEPLSFILPALPPGERWEVLIDTARPKGAEAPAFSRAVETYPLEGRSAVLLRSVQT